MMPARGRQRCQRETAALKLDPGSLSGELGCLSLVSEWRMANGLDPWRDGPCGASGVPGLKVGGRSACSDGASGHPDPG